MFSQQSDSGDSHLSSATSRIVADGSSTGDPKTSNTNRGATYLGLVPPNIESSYLSLSAYRSKPVFDLLAASAAAFVLTPVGVMIACSIRLTSRGPVFLSEERIGKRGLRFQQHAFRITSDKEVALLTPIGRFLDQTGLHKMPQLLNVLSGDMSLVGPKALRPAETHFYGSAMPIILSVKPGILEPRPIPKDERSYEDGTLVQSELDVGYVVDQSFGLDLKICLDAIEQKTAGRS